MRRFDTRVAQPDDEKRLDDALERLVRGDTSGLDQLEPELRATVQQLFAWAGEGGLSRRPTPATHERPRRAVFARLGPIVSGIAAVLVVGLVVLTGYLAGNLSPDEEGTPTRVISAVAVGTVSSEEAALPEPTQVPTNTPVRFATATPTVVPTATPTVVPTATPIPMVTAPGLAPDEIQTIWVYDLYFEPSYVSISRGGFLEFINEGTQQHMLVIEGYNYSSPSVMLGPPSVLWRIPDDLAPGTYTFYCAVPGHRSAGMEGTITITD